MSNIKWANIVPLVGGSAIGCEQATGVEPQFNMSYSAFAKNESHYHKYRPNVPNFVLDSSDSNTNNPLANMNERLDFVNSVCPCAGLSMLTHDKPGKDSETRQKANDWMRKSTAYVLNEVKPRVLWGENAPTMFTNSGKYMRDELIEMALDAGYSASFYRTTTSLHGIPQNRDRTFYFFWDSETAPILNWYKRDRKSFRAYIEDIPKGTQGLDEVIQPSKPLEDELAYQFILHKTGWTHREFIQNIPKLKKGNNLIRFIENNDWLHEAKAFYHQTDPKSPENKIIDRVIYKTSIGKNYMHESPSVWGETSNAMVGLQLKKSIHPTEKRFLTTREVMHMMGMPHDFKFSVRDRDTSLNMLAQNVPTVTARDMALEVVKYLNGELQNSGEKIFMQNNHKQESFSYDPKK
jgi:site-specific DNA-cytosine methylase